MSKKIICLTSVCIISVICSIFITFIFQKPLVYATDYPKGVEVIPLEDDSVGGLGMNSVKYNHIRVRDGICIDNMNKPIIVDFYSYGVDKLLQLTVYYDYNQVKFKVGDSEEYVDRYQFEVEDSCEMEIPIRLDENIVHDNNPHKMMIVIEDITDYPDDYPYQNDMPYRTSIIYTSFNLRHDRSVSVDESIFESTFNSELYLADKPEQVYDRKTEEFNTAYKFILNTDYDNETQLNEKTIAYPESSITVNAGEELELMYNINNMFTYVDQYGITNTSTYENALFFINIDGVQTNIDGKPFKVVDLEPYAVSNGKISIQVPEEKGIYDVTGYLTFIPFSKATLGTEPSNSFKIEVI